MNQEPYAQLQVINRLWYFALNRVAADSDPVGNACFWLTRGPDDARVLAYWPHILAQFGVLFRSKYPKGMRIAAPSLNSPREMRFFRSGLAEALQLWDEAKSIGLGTKPGAQDLLLTPPSTPRPLPIPRPVTPRSPAPVPIQNQIPPPPPPPPRLAATPSPAPPPPPRFDGPPPLPPPLRPPYVPARPLAPPRKPMPVQQPNLTSSPPLPPPQPPSAPSSAPRRLVGGSLGEPAETDDDPTVVALSESNPTTQPPQEPPQSRCSAPAFFQEVTVRPAKVTRQETAAASLIDTTALQAAERKTAEVDTMLAAMLGAHGDNPQSNYNPSR